MFFLQKLTMAVFESSRQSNQSMDIEMEDCASYESFCYSMKTTKKSLFSTFFTNGESESDSDSDDFNWVVDSRNGWGNTSEDIEWSDDDSVIEWANDDDQSLQDEIMDELQIVIEEQTDMSSFIRKVNKVWNEANKDISEKERSATKVSFAPDEDLVEVLPADICDRKGEWELFAIDRLRFQKRIDEVEAVLSPCLSKEHRSKISLMLETDIKQKLSLDSK